MEVLGRWAFLMSEYRYHCRGWDTNPAVPMAWWRRERVRIPTRTFDSISPALDHIPLRLC